MKVVLLNLRVYLALLLRIKRKLKLKCAFWHGNKLHQNAIYMDRMSLILLLFLKWNNNALHIADSQMRVLPFKINGSNKRCLFFAQTRFVLCILKTTHLFCIKLPLLKDNIFGHFIPRLKTKQCLIIYCKAWFWLMIKESSTPSQEIY